MKKNLYINTGGGELKKSESTKNNTSNFLSIINNNKSLTTNESVTAFTSPFNTIQVSNSKILDKKPFLRSKTKYSSSNIFTGYSRSGNNIFLPRINSFAMKTQLFKDADKIMKDRKRQFLGRALKQTKSSILEKSKEICLNNFLITQLREKRDEINNKQIQIYSQLNKSEKRFEIDYKNFIDFVEKINQKEKEEERNLNNLKNISKNVEINLVEEMSINKNLVFKIETEIKQILILQAYGSFIHKVFYKPFVFDELKKINFKGKKFISISNKILSLYDERPKNFEENKYIISDVELLMDKFNYYEQKIVNIMREKEELEQEIKDNNINYQIILAQLKDRKIDSENEYFKLKKEKKEVNNMMTEYIHFDSGKNNNIEEYLKFISELAKDLGIDINKNQKNSKTNEILEGANISEKILKILEEKEGLINEKINNIENVIINGDEKDKNKIEALIYERKKFNKKEKQLYLINLQKMEEKKKRLKAVEKAKRIIVKGRKVFPDIPILKNKNKKIKKEKSNDNEDFEYLNFSSDKED